MSPPGTVAAIVVTYNRVAYLEKCVHLLGAQTRALDEILIFDNSSTDGTAEFLDGLANEVRVIRSEHNVGSAGAFHDAVGEAWSRGHDWLWLMDDDSAPASDALERLLDQVPDGGPTPMILGSRVLWSGNNELHPMNKPIPKLAPSALPAAVAAGLLPIRAASFVSCLVHRRAVDRYGLPDPRYFIWNDDLEYTARVLRREIGYWVPASVVVHDTPNPHTVGMADPWKFYYEVRNKLLMLRGDSWSPIERVRWAKALLMHIRSFLGHQKFSRESVAVVARGLRDGLGPRA